MRINYFITQNPKNIPDGVLSQLGNKIQHALHAYTPTEQKGAKEAAQKEEAARQKEQEKLEDAQLKTQEKEQLRLQKEQEKEALRIQKAKEQDEKAAGNVFEVGSE